MCYSGKCKYEDYQGNCKIKNPKSVVDYCAQGKREETSNKGESSGADEEVRLAETLGMSVHYSLEDLLRWLPDSG